MIDSFDWPVETGDGDLPRVRSRRCGAGTGRGKARRAPAAAV